MFTRYDDLNCLWCANSYLGRILISYYSIESNLINDFILLGYVAKHRDPSLDDFPDVGKWPIHVQISHYAGICAKRLDRIGDTGRLRPKKPSVEIHLILSYINVI